MLNHTRRPLIVAISGDPDPRSGETRLLARTPDVAPATVTVNHALHLGVLPPYGTSGPIPDPVRELEQELAAADGLVVATPPVTGRMAEPVARLLEWLSGTAALEGTPTAVLSTAVAPDAHLAHAALIEDLSRLGARIVARACLAVPGTARAFDDDGNLVDPFVLDVLRVSMAYLVDAVLRSGPSN